MAEPNEKGHHPGPSRSEPSKGKRYEDLTEVERKAAAGKKSQNVAPSKQIDKLLFNSVLRSEMSLVILIYMVSPWSWSLWSAWWYYSGLRLVSVQLIGRKLM